MAVSMRSSQYMYCLLQGFTTQNLLSLLWQFRRKRNKDPKFLKVLQEVREHHDFHQMQHLSSSCVHEGFGWFILPVWSWGFFGVWSRWWIIYMPVIPAWSMLLYLPFLLISIDLHLNIDKISSIAGSEFLRFIRYFGIRKSVIAGALLPGLWGFVSFH